MKKVTILILLFALFLTLSSYAFTANFNDSLACTDQPDFYDSYEFNEISKAIQNANVLHQNNVLSDNKQAALNSELESAYKVHFLASPDFVSELSKGKAMSELISSEYVWIASTSSNQSIRIVSENDNWVVTGYSTPDTSTSSTNLIKLEQVALIITALLAIILVIFFICKKKRIKN